INADGTIEYYGAIYSNPDFNAGSTDPEDPTPGETMAPEDYIKQFVGTWSNDYGTSFTVNADGTISWPAWVENPVSYDGETFVGSDGACPTSYVCKDEYHGEMGGVIYTKEGAPADTNPDAPAAAPYTLYVGDTTVTNNAFMPEDWKFVAPEAGTYTLTCSGSKFSCMYGDNWYGANETITFTATEGQTITFMIGASSYSGYPANFTVTIAKIA
ncbi:MAG: hypothetical protein MJ238_04360, partial [Bacilli bacterium]|nr:hypothetical protein [Bacilli bacterium]